MDGPKIILLKLKKYNVIQITESDICDMSHVKIDLIIAVTQPRRWSILQNSSSSIHFLKSRAKHKGSKVRFLQGNTLKSNSPNFLRHCFLKYLLIKNGL